MKGHGSTIKTTPGFDAHALTTERLVLQPLTESDAPLFHQINTDPFVRRFLWDDEVIPAVASRDIIFTSQRHFDDSNWGLWKVLDKAARHFLGYAGLWCFFDEPQPQLLYALRPQFTGRGYAQEAAAAVIGYAFNSLNFEDLVASMDAPNTASVRVCERLGMQKVEERRTGEAVTLFYRLVRLDDLK